MTKDNSMNKIAISVIVPIYNMEWCMRKCIDSILAQTFTDFECLLIDDGSTDGSPNICDEYAQKDARIKVYHKPNGGLSDARNFGLERALGEYTIFADPDDWVDAEGLDQLYEKAKETNADMVMCDLYYNDSFRQTYRKQEPTSVQHLDVLRDLIVGKVSGFTVTKLIKRELYQKYNLQYPVGMYGCEDQYTICKLLKNDIKIAYLPQAYYHYMHYGQDSLSRHYEEKTYQQDLNIRNLFTELVQENSELKVTAWEKKTLYMVSRAFLYGRNSFDNLKFKKEFYQYKSLISTSKMAGNVKIPAYLSCYGGYRFWNFIFWKGFQVKQVFKEWNHKRI